MPRASSLRDQVLAFIRDAGEAGATNEEISTALEMKIQTVCPRVYELRANGQVKDSGERRMTTAGVRAKVWRVPPPPRTVQKEFFYKHDSNSHSTRCLRSQLRSRRYDVFV